MKELIVKSFIALPVGLKICLLNLKKYCVIPWLIGVFAYFVSLSILYSYYDELSYYLKIENYKYLSILSNYFAWFVVNIFILFCSSLISILTVLILNAVNSSNIAYEVLKLENAKLPTMPDSYLRETARVVTVEVKKLVLLLPLFIFSFVLTISGVFTILGFILSSFLLMFQFIDITLDLYQIPVRRRVSIIFANIFSMLIFGMTLNLVFIIPLLGIFIAPIAVASAAWLISDEKFQKSLVS